MVWYSVIAGILIGWQMCKWVYLHTFYDIMIEAGITPITLTRAKGNDKISSVVIEEHEHEWFAYNAITHSFITKEKSIDLVVANVKLKLGEDTLITILSEDTTNA